jgi:hypothetical protein
LRSDEGGRRAISIRREDRPAYLTALEAADRGVLGGLAALVAERLAEEVAAFISSAKSD